MVLEERLILFDISFIKVMKREWSISEEIAMAILLRCGPVTHLLSPWPASKGTWSIILLPIVKFTLVNKNSIKNVSRMGKRVVMPFGNVAGWVIQ